MREIITGVGNANYIGEWDYDFIDLQYETAVQEKRKELITEFENNNEEYDEDEVTFMAQEELIDFNGTDQLYGSWLQDEEGKYYPNINGEYAMIYDSNENVYQVVHSKWAIRCYKCSPCYPGQGDIDTEGSLLAYMLPPDMMREEWIEENQHRFVEL